MYNLCNQAALHFGRHVLGYDGSQPTNPEQLTVTTSTTDLLQCSGQPVKARKIQPGATAADAYRVSTSFDKACETEATYWSTRYLIGSSDKPRKMSKPDYDACVLFKSRWDTFCRHRNQVRQLQSKGKLEFDVASEYYTILAGSLAVAFELANPKTSEWTEETLRRYFPTGAIYNGPSSVSNALNQLLKILASGGSLGAETYGYVHPETRATVVMAKACINMTYALAVTAVAIYSIKRNAALQSPAVAQVASETSKESWNSAINSSKRIDEDGTLVPMRQTKHVKHDWNTIEKTESLIKAGQASPLTAYKNQLQARAEQKQIIIDRFNDEQRRNGTISKWKQNEIKRLTEHLKFLSKIKELIKPHQDPYTDRITRQTKIADSLPKIDEVRNLLTHDLIVCQAYKQLNTAKNGGIAKAIRNSLNCVYTGLGLSQNICDYLSLTDDPVVNTFEPEPELQPYNDMYSTDLSGVKLALGWSALVVAITQPLAYRYAGTRLVHKDFLDKLATQFKLTAATGLGNTLSKAGEVDPKKIDDCVAGPIQVRIKHMITAMTPDLMLRAALISDDLTTTMCRNGLAAASTDASPTFEIIYAQLKALLSFSKTKNIKNRLGDVQEYIDNILGGTNKSNELDGLIAELNDVAIEIDLLETKQLDTFLALKSVPDDTRAIFQEALLHGLGISDHADSDRKLAAMAGSAEKNSFIGNRLQLAAKLAVALEYYFCGNISPLMISAVSKATVEALHFWYGFDDHYIERVISYIKIPVSGIALCGTLLSIGMAFANGPHVEIKNLRRNLLSDHPDVPNAGTLNPGEPGTELRTGPNFSSMRHKISNFRTIASKPVCPQLLPSRIDFTSEISLWSEFSKQVFAANLQFTSGGLGKTPRKYLGYFFAEQGKLDVRSEEEFDKILRDAGKDIKIAINRSLPTLDTVTNVDRALSKPLSEKLRGARFHINNDENITFLNSNIHNAGQSGWGLLQSDGIYISSVKFNTPDGKPDGKGFQFISANRVDETRQLDGYIDHGALISCYNDPADPTQPFHQRQTAADCTLATVNMMLKRNVSPDLPYSQLLTREKVVSQIKRLRNKGKWKGKIEETQFSALAMASVSKKIIGKTLSSFGVNASGEVFDVRSSMPTEEDNVEFWRLWIGAQPSACLTMAYGDNSDKPKYHSVLIECLGHDHYQIIDARHSEATWSCSAGNLLSAAIEYRNAFAYEYEDSDYNLMDLILFDTTGAPTESQSSS